MYHTIVRLTRRYLLKANLIGFSKKAKRKNTWNNVYVDQYVENGEEYIKVYSLPDTI